MKQTNWVKHLTMAAMRSSSSAVVATLPAPRPCTRGAGSQGPGRAAPAVRAGGAAGGGSDSPSAGGGAGTSLSTGASASPPTHTAVLLSPADRASRSRWAQEGGHQRPVSHMKCAGACLSVLRRTWRSDAPEDLGHDSSTSTQWLGERARCSGSPS